MHQRFRSKVLKAVHLLVQKYKISHGFRKPVFKIFAKMIQLSECFLYKNKKWQKEWQDELIKGSKGNAKFRVLTLTASKTFV